MMVIGGPGGGGREGGICRTTVANFAPICPDITTAVLSEFKFIQNPKHLLGNFWIICFFVNIKA